MSQGDVRARLRAWVAQASSGKVMLADLRDDTPILEQRLITSVQVPELLLLIEELSGQPLDPGRLKPGVFRDVDAICRNFFPEGRPS